jgi:hypothetical protein
MTVARIRSHRLGGASFGRGRLGGDDKVERAENSGVGRTDCWDAFTTRAAVAAEPGSSPALRAKST